MLAIPLDGGFVLTALYLVVDAQIDAVIAKHHLASYPIVVPGSPRPTR